MIRTRPKLFNRNYNFCCTAGKDRSKLYIGGLIEYPQFMFYIKKKKIMRAHVNHILTIYIKVGFEVVLYTGVSA